LNADTSLNDEHFFNKTILAKKENYERGGRLKLELTFCFVETIHETLRLHKWSLGQ
jgi:hypothetical protein